MDGQEVLLDIKNNADCTRALKINTKLPIGPTIAPDGYGNVLEIDKNAPSNKYFFEKEHHTVWYKFVAAYSALLVFDIEPLSAKDDYDFLLFRIDQPGFCTKVSTGSILPVRSNIARNDDKTGAKTGLKLNEKQKFKSAGPGSSYSAALNVSKGQLYYLILDNVYPNGQGHKITFDYLRKDGSSMVKLNYDGKLLSSDGQAVSGKIKLTDKNGTVVAEVQTRNDGTYSLEIPKNVDLSKKYCLSMQGKGFFYTGEEIDLKDGIGKNTKVKTLNPLKVGEILRITNINFYEDSPQYLPGAIKVLDRIVEMMKLNSGLHLEISGYIDGCKGDERARRILSEGRAENIKRYLVDQGIDPDRLSTKGYGCTRMIYPDPIDEEQHLLNRRVEIKVTHL